jgi:hypothetical protein
MARHETFTLDSETAFHAATMRGICAKAHETGTSVSLTVQKRDTGEVSTRTGQVLAFSGMPGLSTDSVTVETVAGPRTFNTWLIRSAEIVGE